MEKQDFFVGKRVLFVDENDNVIGQDTRENVHQKGLLHREVQVIIYNDQKKILFQKRSDNVETRLGLWTSGAGGHVNLGDKYNDTVIRELREETGIITELEDLNFLAKIHIQSCDKVKNTINNKFVAVYSYRLKQSDVLKPEKGKVVGFNFWSVREILNFSQKEKEKFSPTAISDQLIEIYKQILNK